MSNNGYYYPPSNQKYQSNQNNHNWSTNTANTWQHEQQQYNRASNPPNTAYPPPLLQRPSSNFYPSNRAYSQPPPSPRAKWPASAAAWRPPAYGYKRPHAPEPPSAGAPREARSRPARKKRKPLSLSVPSKKEWTIEEAAGALNVEKEFNKRFLQSQLIIKFPDLELSRDIVSAFHTSIENVHFQQPSTARFCFVTLNDTADAEKVIRDLNKIPFGSGHITAEFKKDREEDQNIRPEDIDPLTLYVGNLAQEITKEDMVKAFPNSRRIDIGYAKKMKYTRYAFVAFNRIADSIDAFRQTHRTQMHSKSLIVRFRRLHGTVGMPGEYKPQSPAKSGRPGGATVEVGLGSNGAEENGGVEVGFGEEEEVEGVGVGIAEGVKGWKEVEVGKDAEVGGVKGVGGGREVVVKQEAVSDGEEEDILQSGFLAGSIDSLLGRHRPQEVVGVKQEVAELEEMANGWVKGGGGVIEAEIGVLEGVKVKEEPMSDVVGDYRQFDVPMPTQMKIEGVEEGEEEEEEGDEDYLDVDVNFGSLINQLDDRSEKLKSLRRSIL